METNQTQTPAPAAAPKKERFLSKELYEQCCAATKKVVADTLREQGLGATLDVEAVAKALATLAGKTGEDERRWFTKMVDQIVAVTKKARVALHQRKYQAALVAVEKEPDRDFLAKPLTVEGEEVSIRMIDAARHELRKRIAEKQAAEKFVAVSDFREKLAAAMDGINKTL